MYSTVRVNFACVFLSSQFAGTPNGCQPFRRHPMRVFVIASIVTVLAIGVVLFVVVEGFAVVALLSALTGENLARCPRCHRYALTKDGVAHPAGCPDHLGSHLLHSWASLIHRIESGRLRHHGGAH
jgi:hypothetical protein